MESAGEDRFGPARRGEQAEPEQPESEQDRTLTEAELDRICLFNLLSATADMIYFKDRQSRFIRVSRSAAEFTGAGVPEEMVGKSVRDYFTPEHVAAAFAVEQAIMRSGQPVNDTEEPHLRPHTGDDEVLSTSKQPLRDFDGRIIGTFGISRDITARKAGERELVARTAELGRMGKELRTLLDTSPDPMARFDRDLRHTYANPAAQEISGTPEKEMLGKTNRELGDPEEFVGDWERALRQVLRTGVGTEREFSIVIGGKRRFLHTRFVPETGEDGLTLSVLAVSRDLTERRLIEEALARQAVRDPLTGLANRALLVDRIQQAIERGTGPGRLAVLFLDLDRFKLVNDSLGHAAGDELLVAVAGRLAKAVRREDLVARFGGTSSSSCARAWTGGPGRPRSPSGSVSALSNRSTARAGPSTCGRVSASRWPTARERRPTPCCVTPTRPCTRSRRSARRPAATGSSSPRRTSGPCAGSILSTICARPSTAANSGWSISRWSTSPAAGPSARKR